MNIEAICQSLEQEKIRKDIINAKYLESFDYDICNYTIENIPNINYLSYRGKLIFKKYAIKKSIEEFKIFNEENNQRLLEIITNIKFLKDYPLHNCATATTYNIRSNCVITPGTIYSYHIPKKIYDVDIICLGHEHCHALKETNYEEHKNQLILGEVIPIFFELINYENIFLKRKHLEYRLYGLQEQKEVYIELSHFLKEQNIKENKSIYEYTKSYLGSYLSGFYYAIILYNIYKNNPIKILNLINQVLSHKITTLDMLKKLNIYRSIQGKTFESEITTMKKVLSK